MQLCVRYMLSEDLELWKVKEREDTAFSFRAALNDFATRNGPRPGFLNLFSIDIWGWADLDASNHPHSHTPPHPVKRCPTLSPDYVKCPSEQNHSCLRTLEEDNQRHNLRIGYSARKNDLDM